jgi:glutamate dehydrogenase
MAKTLAINTANIIGSASQKFPEYIEPDFSFDFGIMAPVEAPLPNRGIEHLKQSPGRHPSPQPIHFSYKNGNGNGHRVLRSTTIGYEAPEFKGKQAQMVQG